MSNTSRETTKSVTVPLTIAESDQEELAARHRWWHRLNRAFYLGVTLIALLILLAWAGPLLLHYDPLKLDMTNSLQSPSREHLLGTDIFGRDMLTRILYAIRIDLTIAVSATIYTMIIGVAIGSMAGYYGGVVDTLFMRFVDILIAFPRLVLLIGVIAMLGQSTVNIFIAIGLVGWIPYARLVRGDILVVKEQEYIQAARIIGARDRRVIWRHLMPNAITPAAVFATSDVIGNILFVAALSFLGLGIQPPTPELGTMIAEGRKYMLTYWNQIIFPGFAIMLIGIPFIVLGDGLADFLRPQG